MAEASKPIELTQEETYALESVLKNDDTEDGVRAAKPLLLKIGSAFLQQNTEGEEPTLVTLVLTEKETWLCRDRIPITLQIGHASVGLTLKKKLYKLLLEFDTDAKAKDVVEELAMDAAALQNRRSPNARKNATRHNGKANHNARAAKAPRA